MPRKPPPPPQPIRTYGCRSVTVDEAQARLGEHAQFFFNQWAFANFRTAVDHGAPPRNELFWLIADTLMPGYFIRDPWSDKLITAACNNNWVGMAGCGGCVIGSTRIDDPVTGQKPTIAYLCENRIRPTVMTLEGPKLADVPFVKGVEELFEVRLSDGSSFCSTAGHLVLTPSGFSRVGDLFQGQHLFSYAQVPLGSTLGLGLSTRGPDVLGSRKTTLNCRENYLPDYRLCGAQLPRAIKASQSPSPSQACAPARSQHNFCSGDLVSGYTHIHPLKCDALPSMKGLATQDFHKDTLAQYLHDLKTVAPYDRSFQQFWQFFSVASLLSQASGQVRGCARTQSSFDGQHLTFCSDFAYQVAEVFVTKVSAVGKHVYYDISVPGPEHYFAEGAIHHNSGKTHVVTGFAVVWWLCSPSNSSVMLTSTTAKALRKRNWANIHKLHSFPHCAQVGNFVDSRMIWQAKRGDDLHSITGVAVEEGDTKASGDKIKGTHTKRQMVVVNEANSVNAGIWEAIYNLYSYPEQCGGEFIVIAEANPSSWLDEFGKFTEPLNGVKSVSVDDDEWETTPKLNGKTGICIRFDVEKTPNLDYPPDKPINKHLPSRERAERCMRSPQKDSPLYWSNERGFPPPEGLNKNVFSEVALQQCGAFERHKFTGNKFEIIGAFDPSRGGDQPMLRFAALGELESGEMGIEWMAPKPMRLDLKQNNPIDYQLLEQVRAACENVMYRGMKTTCPPRNLGIDATGGGANLCDTFQRNWSFDIMRIGFGEAPSHDAVSPEDVRFADEVYLNRRAEMYFRTRGALDSGQIKGVDTDTAKEMCTIEYDDSKVKRKVINKDDYKKKFRKSPDATDTGVIITEVARRKGFKQAVLGQTKIRRQDVNKVFEESQNRFSEVSYGAHNEDDQGPSMEITNPYELVNQ